MPLTIFVKKSILKVWLDSAYTSGMKDGNGFFPKKHKRYIKFNRALLNFKYIWNK